jgi:hypothetical protein
MRKVVIIVLTAASFGLASGATSAGTIELRGVYSTSVVGPDCVHAGGTRTPGLGPGGYGCKTEKGEVECTSKGRCTAICEVCGPRHHRTGIYGILHGYSGRKRGG